MTKLFLFSALVFSMSVINNGLYAQSFNKGSLLISISEGSSHVSYNTINTTIANDGGNHGNVGGDRDPISIEYGLSKHWGIGINSGADIYKINAFNYYTINNADVRMQTLNTRAPLNDFKVITSELTVDAYYHYFVTKHTDLSLFTSIGPASISVKGNYQDQAYQYTASGAIVRAGAKARYYITKRFGFMAMLSTFRAGYISKDIKDNTMGIKTSTSVYGNALEFGLCYRLLK